MKWFYTIFQWIILILLIANPLLAFIFGEIIVSMSMATKYSVLALVIIIEFFIIITLVNRLFLNPIVNLEITIKKFITWTHKWSDIKFHKTLNSNLNFILAFFAKTLNTLKNIKSEFLHGKEIKSEVQLWKEIQWKMLEKKLLEVPSLDIIMKSTPAWEIGWDSYDIIKQDDNYYIYVWDATGHWVWAWLIMIMVNALISGFAKIFKSGADILSKTNEILKPRVKANLLMSLLLIRWDEKAKRVFMTGAWHEYLMIYKHKQNKTFKIKSGWVALGMIQNISKLLKEKEIRFEPNDIIVLYSDWITEAINKTKKDGSEEMFWEERLIESINNAPIVDNQKYKSARSVFNNITIDLSQFMWYKHSQFDDITLAVLHYKDQDFSKVNNFSEEIKEDFITEWNW